MTDYFALLGEARRPWLDPEALKRNFLTRSTELHPDRIHQADAAEKAVAHQHYTDLNAAYQCLRDPKERLGHLLELERGSRPRQVESIPPKLMEQFLELSRLCKQTDELLAQKQATTAALLKVPLFELAQEWTEQLTAQLRQLNQWREELLVELRAIDAGWEAAAGRGAALDRLEELCRLFGYCGRWSAQLQERVVQLSF